MKNLLSLLLAAVLLFCCALPAAAAEEPELPEELPAAEEAPEPETSEEFETPEDSAPVEEADIPEESDDAQEYATAPEEPAGEAAEPELILFESDDLDLDIEINTDNLRDSDELFAAYVDHLFSTETPRLRGLYPQYLTLGDREKTAYDCIYTAIQEIFAGERTSTVFTIKVSDLLSEEEFNKTYTAEDLGVDSLTKYEDGKTYVTSAAGDAMRTKVSVDFNAVLSALQNDHPYEMFWYDKTEKGSISPPRQFVVPNGIRFAAEAQYTLSLIVAEAFRGQDEYSVKTEAITAAQKASNNAQSIAAAIDTSDVDDIQKLIDICDKIRKLSGYNYAATANTPYGDPWQLVYVFDGDPETKVVCEGYSKAFKYLCDLMSFEYDITTYSVQGYLDGGAHMWNIVTMPDGWNYLVDVTNMTNSGDLFLKGCTGGSTETGYTYARRDSTLTYTYSDNSRLYFSQTVLAMSPINYGMAGDVNGDHAVDVSDLLCLLKSVNGQQPDSLKPAFADVTGDGTVNTADLLRLLRKIIHTDVTVRYYGDNAELPTNFVQQ